MEGADNQEVYQPGRRQGLHDRELRSTVTHPLFALQHITAPPNCDSIPFTTQILEEADNRTQVTKNDFHQFDYGENTGMIISSIALLLN